VIEGVRVLLQSAPRRIWLPGTSVRVWPSPCIL